MPCTVQPGPQRQKCQTFSDSLRFRHRRFVSLRFLVVSRETWWVWLVVQHVLLSLSGSLAFTMTWWGRGVDSGRLCLLHREKILGLRQKFFVSRILQFRLWESLNLRHQLQTKSCEEQIPWHLSWPNLWIPYSLYRNRVQGSKSPHWACKDWWLHLFRKNREQITIHVEPVESVEFFVQSSQLVHLLYCVRRLITEVAKRCQAALFHPSSLARTK